MIFLIYDGFSDKTILKHSVLGSLTGILYRTKNAVYSLEIFIFLCYKLAK
jgi:hypothetical protein